MRDRILHILAISAFILAFGALGYYRDVLFRHVNSQISVLEYGSDAFEFWWGTGFLEHFTLEGLYRFKWVGTIVFAVLNYGLSLMVLLVWFRSKKNVVLLSLMYAAVFFMAAIGMIIGKLLPGAAEYMYYFSRWLMGAAQSPLLVMVMVVLLVSPLRRKD
jgi:hypothetical protein